MQQRLEENTGQSPFSPLLNDVDFIKKHLRYPLNRYNRHILLGALGTLLFASILVTVIIVIGLNSSEHIFRSAKIIPLFAIFMMLRVSWSTIRSLRFRSIRTTMNKITNTQLVKDFLEQLQIAYYQSPIAPEVFQIASRPLNPEGSQREIMVFIADDLQILLNSHYTNGASKAVPLKFSSEYRKMETALRQWLSRKEQNGTSIIRRRF